MQIDFDIAAARRFAGELHNGTAEVRSSFMIPETGMKNAHSPAVQGLQLVALQPLVLPDTLTQSVRRRGFFRLPQRGRGLSERSPLIIKIGRRTGHLAIAFRLRLLQSQAYTTRQRARVLSGSHAPEIERTQKPSVELTISAVRNANSFRCRAAWLLALAGWLSNALPATPLRGAETDVRRDATVAAIEKLMPSVVNIATIEIVEYTDPFSRMFREFWDPYYRHREADARYSLGSGVIIDEDGYVLTNLHVVRRASRVWVKLADGREFEAKAIVGNTRRDVALLKLITKGNEKFRAVKFAPDDDLLLGETVLALGNPFGLCGSVSRGILSSKNRRPPLENEPLDVADWLQTDAAINPGSSGGPLTNLKGELIGLNVAIYREGHGIGFAIPIKQVTDALSEILIPEVTKSLWFGARIKSGPYPLAITGVESASPAEKAGLQKGDVIVQVDGKPPKGFIQCTEWIGDSPKREVTLAVQRKGERREMTAKMVALADVIRQKLGASVQEMTQELAENFGYHRRDGLLIAEVDPDGPAARADLKSGYLLAGIDGQATPDLLAATGLLTGKKKGDRAELTITVRRQRGAFTSLNQGSVTVRVR